MSGMPIAAPAEFLHATMSSTLLRNSASPPTMAKSSAHALMMALRVSFGFNFESTKSIATLRPAMPPSLLTCLAQAFIASTDFWNRPGWMGVSTSAMTATRISESVMPTSSALGLALCAPAPATAKRGADQPDHDRDRDQQNS